MQVYSLGILNSGKAMNCKHGLLVKNVHIFISSLFLTDLSCHSELLLINGKEY